MSKPYFNVAPRYTPGSPAMVDERTARRVAQEEQNGYDQVLTGIYGEEEVRRAKKLGLAGIVEQRIERTSRKLWQVEDLITGEKFERLFPTHSVSRYLNRAFGMRSSKTATRRKF